MMDAVQTFIEHHGIKGQRWGVKRDLQEKRREFDKYQTFLIKRKEQGGSKNAMRRKGEVGSKKPATPEEIAAAAAAAAAAKKKLEDAEKAKEDEEKAKEEKKAKGGGGGAPKASLKKDKEEKKKEKGPSEEEKKYDKASEEARDLAFELSETATSGRYRGTSDLIGEASSIKNLLKLVGGDSEFAKPLQELYDLTEKEITNRESARTPEQMSKYAQIVRKASRELAKKGSKKVKHGNDETALFIEHHGIKGQKWGVRRDNPSGSKPAKTEASKLSDDELRKRVNRLNMEQQYKKLLAKKADDEATPSERGQKYVEKFMKKQSEYALNRAANNVTNYIVDNPDKVAGAAKKVSKAIVKRVTR